MTYEFNAGDSGVNDFPNPYKIENIFLLLCAAVLSAGGISVLLSARAYLQDRQDPLAAATAVLAIGLFGAAIKLAIQAMSQLRFFLGRQFPRSLAEDMPIAGLGLAKGALEIMHALRQQAIEFPEPRGPVNGILYFLIKPLITSPAAVQAAAVRHFHAVLAITAMSASLLVSYGLFRGAAFEAAVSWLYLPLAAIAVLAPLLANRDQAELKNDDGDAQAMLWKLIAMVAFAVLAPATIPRFAPALEIPPIWIAPLLLLSAAMGTSLLFLASLFAQLDNVSQTGVSCERTTVSMNCHPAQLWTKVSRDFQDQWVRNIPNRSYANVPPGSKESDRGAFQGYILEETQPTASMASNPDKHAAGLKHARYRMLLSAWGLALAGLMAIVAAHHAPLFAQMARMEIARIFLIVIALGAATILAIGIGHLLYSRMYFTSRLVWIVVDGTYQTSQLSIGNRYASHVQSTSTLTRVEDATLRVWVADIVSVAFGKDGKRSIIAMAPADGFTKATAERLVQFAREQSAVAAPTSSRDIAKIQALGMLNETISALSGNGRAALVEDRFMPDRQTPIERCER